MNFLLEWSLTMTRRSSATYENQALMINEPTRCTMNAETLIDLAFVSDEFKIANSFSIEYGISDHQLIGITRKMNCRKFSPRKIYARNYKYYSERMLSNRTLEAYRGEIYCLVISIRHGVHLKS